MNKKSIFIPVVILIALLALILYENMNMQLSLPSSDWSRSFSLNIASQGPIQTFVRQEGEEHHLYTTKDGQVIHTVYGSELQHMKQEMMNVSVPAQSKIWSKNQYVVFLDEANLTVSDGKSKKIVAQDITNFSSYGDSIVYWKGNKLYELDIATWESVWLNEFQAPVYDVVFDQQTGACLTITTPQDSEYRFTLFTRGENGFAKKQELTTLTMAGAEELTAMTFVQDQDEIHIVYGTFSTAQGVKTYRAYEWTLNMKELQQAVAPKLMHIQDATHNWKFENIQDVRIHKMDDGMSILFAAEGPTVSKYMGNNVYEAKKSGDIWTAERKSTTQHTPIAPFWLNDNSMAWTVFSAKEYTLYASSGDAEMLKKSQEITDHDWKLATSHAVTALFGSFMIIIFALAWVALPLLVYIVAYFFKADEFEREPLKTRMELALIGMYVVSQLFFLNKVFSKDMYVSAPDYLSFGGSFIIIPLILVIVTWVILKVVRTEEWGIGKGFSYFAAVNIAMMTLLFGPYLL